MPVPCPFLTCPAAPLMLQGVMALRPEWNALPLILEFLDKGSREYGAGIDTRIGSLRPLVNVEDVLTSAAWGGSAPAHRVSLSGADVSSRLQTEEGVSTPTFGSHLLPRLGPERNEGDEEVEEGEEDHDDMITAGEGHGEGHLGSKAARNAGRVRGQEAEHEELRLTSPPQEGLSATSGATSPLAHPVRHSDSHKPGVGQPDWAVRSEVLPAPGGVARPGHLGGLEDTRSDPGLGAGAPFLAGPAMRGNDVGDFTSSGHSSSRRGAGDLGPTEPERQSSATEEDDTVLPIEVWAPARPLA